MHASTNRGSALLVFLCGPIIDFLEELVVLTDLRIVRVELQRLLVGLARFVELSFVLVAGGRVVIGGGVTWIDLGGLLPGGDCLAPRTTLRGANSELHLRLRVFF